MYRPHNNGLQATHNSWNTAALLPFTTRLQTWQELWQMQQAVLQQTQQMQQGWMQGWTAWLGEFGQFKRANTMSKLVEQEFNLLAQLVLLLQGQIRVIGTAEHRSLRVLQSCP